MNFGKTYIFLWNEKPVIQTFCSLLFTLLLISTAVGTPQFKEDYTYNEYWGFGDPSVHDWDTGWIPMPSIWPERDKVNFSWVTGCAYDVSFPTNIYAYYDPDKVTPGNTFPVTIVMDTYDDNSTTEYATGVPGAEVKWRAQKLYWSWSKMKFRWRTVAQLGYDYLLDISEDGLIPLGTDERTFSDSISHPSLPSLADFFISLNYVAKHQMKDREITSPNGISVSSNASIASQPDCRWDYNGKEVTAYVSINKNDCNEWLYLSLEPSELHYKSRSWMGNKIVFLPGILNLTYEKESNWLYELLEVSGLSNFMWRDNHDCWDCIEGADPNNTYNVVIQIPVKHKPDLLPRQLDIEFVEFGDSNVCIAYPPGFPGEAKPRFVPRLRAVVENQGCTDAGAFNVAFYGVNHGQKVSRDKRQGGLDQQGGTITVWSDPIMLWDREFKVVVDSNAEIEETDESNNEMTEELHICVECPSALPDGTRLFDPCSRPVVIDIQPDFKPGSINIVTPVPDFNDFQLSDPVKVRNPKGNRQFVVDFSYIYDVLANVAGHQYVVKLPGEPIYTLDPCGVIITVPDVPDPCFVYEIWDLIPTPTTISVEQFDVIVDGTAPTSPAFVIEPPSLVGDYSLRNVEVTELSEANSVMAIIHSYDDAVNLEYGPYDLNGSVNFTFPSLSLRAGENTVEIASFDDAGNRASTSRVVELHLGFDPNDVNGPVIRIVEPSGEPNVYVRTSTPQITAYVSDIVDSNIGSGVRLDSVTVTIDSTVYTVSDGVEVSPGGLVRFTPPPLSEGLHDVNVTALDLNVNPGTAQMQFTVDTIGPVIDPVLADPPVFKPRDTYTRLIYTLSEDAAVAITVHAGIQVDDESYRRTVRADGLDNSNQVYTPIGFHNEDMYYGLVSTCEPNEEGECTVVDYELDDGLYTFLIRAVDRAGNEDSAEGRFEVQHSPDPRSLIDPNKSQFEISPILFSDCNALIATVTLYDSNEEPVGGRVVGIKLVSDANDADVFFTGASRQGVLVAAPSDVNGQIMFPVERIVIGDANIQCKLLMLPWDCDPCDPNSCAREGGLATIGGPDHKVYITSDSICAQSVDESKSDVNLVGQSTVCSPFYLEVTLRDSNNDPLGEVTVGVRAISSRTDPTVDYFFKPTDPQGEVTPIYTDPNGKALIPVRSIERGSATYTVYLDRNGNNVTLGSVGVNVTFFCMERPSPTYSYVMVVPPITYADVDANVVITLKDDVNQPVANTTFAVQPLSDRNNSEMLDLFGDPVSTDPDYFEIITTDPNGRATIPVRSINTGMANISVKVLSVRGDTEITGDLLAVAGVDGDWVHQEDSSFVIDPCTILPGETTNGVITLVDCCDTPLGPNTLVGLRISSNRNNRPETPYCVDYFFTPTGQQKPIVAKTTDSNGQIQVPITSNVPGTAHVLVEVATSSGWIPVGWHTVSFGDTDGDNVPDDEDLCSGYNDNQDCDSDGVPDGCDDNDGADGDGDDVPDDCDNCPNDYNPDQNDVDADGIGGLCDNCHDVYNPSQTDSDGDNFGNACEEDCPNLDSLNPVDFIDFSILAADWLVTDVTLPGDLNINGVVDINDLAIFSLYWLSDCYEQ